MCQQKTFLFTSAAKIKGETHIAKKVSCVQPLPPSIIPASSTKKGKPMKKQEIIAAIAGSVLAASIFTGCVIGHAKFEGEDMHLYPFWQTNAETSSAQASAEVE